MRFFRSTTSSRALAGLLMAALFSGSLLQAQDDNSRGVVVESTNDNPSWYVRVKVDHDNGIYKVGDEMKVSVVSEREGYLYLMYYDANKKWSCLFPNKVQTDNRIPAKTEIPIPAPEAKFKLRVTPPTGKEILMAYVSLEPLKCLKVEDLNKKDVTPLTEDQIKGVVAEINSGNTETASGQTNKEKLKQKPREYLANSRRWSEHHIVTEVVEDKPAAQRAKMQRLGLFIGISQYQDARIRKLRCSHLDAEKMADTMKRFGGLTADPIVITNDKATLKNIEKTIRQELVERTRPGDTVIIFWSGHGGRCAAVQHDGPDREPDGFDEFLVPYDGKLDDIDTMRTTMLMDDTFGRWVQALDGRKVMVVLDACHSGGQASTPAKSLEDYGKGIGTFGAGAREDGKYKSFFFSTELERISKDIKQKDAAVLASSRAAQVSFERRQGDLSVMTYYLIEQINGSRGTTTIQDAYDNLKGKVPAYVEKEFPGTTQTPLIAGEITPPAYVKP
jgi:uncharacterized caspase-like protein